jgi:hypothetical protein
MVEWELSGDAVEGCTSPPVCPYYWGSSVQKDLHDGKDQCEATFTLRIDKGHHKRTLLNDLIVGIAFNTPADGRQSGNPWAAILYINENADVHQYDALAYIFRTSWARVGKLTNVKKAGFVFEKEAAGIGTPPGYRYKVECKGFYRLETEPFLTSAGMPRFISGIEEGIIYVGKSTINECIDPDLPRGNWDKPGMSNVYFNFAMNPLKLDWVP